MTKEALRKYRREYQRRWRQKNREKYRIYQKEYYRKWKKKNRKKIREYKKTWSQENKEKVQRYQLSYRQKHGVKIRQETQLYRQENKNDIQERDKSLKYKILRRIRRKEYRKNPRFRLDHNVATAVCCALNGIKAGRKWEKLVGYSLKDLIHHLEIQFDKNMTWDNYGSHWHVDHIIPKSWFVYKEPEDIGFKMCWDLDNLQPLEKSENMKKNNYYIKMRSTQEDK